MKGIIDNNVFIRNNNQGSRKLSILLNSEAENFQVKLRKDFKNQLSHW